MSPHWCILCKEYGEEINQLLRHCKFSRFRENKKFQQLVCEWVSLVVKEPTQIPEILGLSRTKWGGDILCYVVKERDLDLPF